MTDTGRRIVFGAATCRTSFRRTRAPYTIHSETVDDLGRLHEKFHRCFEAIATGSKLAIVGGDKPYRPRTIKRNSHDTASRKSPIEPSSMAPSRSRGRYSHSSVRMDLGPSVSPAAESD